MSIRTLPYSLGAALTSGLSGVIVSYIGQYRIMLQLGFAILTVGMGLMSKLDAYSSTYV